MLVTVGVLLGVAVGTMLVTVGVDVLVDVGAATVTVGVPLGVDVGTMLVTVGVDVFVGVGTATVTVGVLLGIVVGTMLVAVGVAVAVGVDVGGPGVDVLVLSFWMMISIAVNLPFVSAVALTCTRMPTRICESVRAVLPSRMMVDPTTWTMTEPKRSSETVRVLSPTAETSPSISTTPRWGIFGRFSLEVAELGAVGEDRDSRHVAAKNSAVTTAPATRAVRMRRNRVRIGSAVLMGSQTIPDRH